MSPTGDPMCPRCGSMLPCCCYSPYPRIPALVGIQMPEGHVKPIGEVHVGDPPGTCSVSGTSSPPNALPRDGQEVVHQVLIGNEERERSKRLDIYRKALESIIDHGNEAAIRIAAKALLVRC